MIVELLAALFVCGVVGNVVGSFRGRGTAGFWLGFLFGPVGWCVTLLLEDLRPKCPKCKGALIAGATRCAHCGYDLVQAERLRSRACSFCGALMRPGAKRCPSCGNPLGPE